MNINEKDEKSDNRIIKRMVIWKGKKICKKYWIKYQNEKWKKKTNEKWNIENEKWKLKKWKVKCKV